MSKSELALRRMVGYARAYVLVTRDMDAHLWEMEQAELELDRAARAALAAGATQAEVERVTAAVATLMDVEHAQTANAAG